MNNFLNTNNPLGLKIQELRRNGCTYKDIRKQLNISNSTISYYCNADGRKKVELRRKRIIWKYKLNKKIDLFKHRIVGKSVTSCKDWNKRFRTACSEFRLRNKIMSEKFTYKDALQHLGGINTKCYLTGRCIDITKDDYCLDHIIPVSKGGTNDLNNMGITIPIVNASKSNMTIDEYLALCKEVLEYNGYKVEKINEL